MAAVEQRVHDLEIRVTAIEDDVARIDRDLNAGWGDRPSLRARVHALEQSEIAVKAAEAARDALRSAQAAHRSASERRLTLAVAGGNLLVVVAGVLAAWLH